ncbi:GNAT family N-acetyltransferase [Caulobacter sp. 17J80-11]|uniref:GNAT family N-acetyltransferase n=1 Tax=Caulobacter sp. 17J80-11 TaxID=2763502 RepID=UPI00165396D9|nr:GNAT family N-acetyltransferase [Caulobacter sp. 17J80-11]MBC6980683.1 GNAT family N-acetyltransferase [Caulobacter sp. 17J80-11]
MITAADIEAIERATLAALPPRTLVEDDGWLLAANDGAIGRVNSVVPLDQGRDLLAAKLERAFAFYADAGLPPAFRVSRFSGPDLETALSARGLRPEQPTAVMIADTGAVAAALAGVAPAERVGTPDEAWRAVFLGAGFDPVEGARRAATLVRAADAAFAQVRSDGETVAIGALGFGAGWAGIHGMRTAQAHRRRGLALQVLSTLVAAAAERGVERLFLQVEEANAVARALYARLGFVDAYRYSYWRPPQP